MESGGRFRAGCMIQMVRKSKPLTLADDWTLLLLFIKDHFVQSNAHRYRSDPTTAEYGGGDSSGMVGGVGGGRVGR